MSILLSSRGANMRGIIKESVAMVCVIRFLSKRKTMNGGGEEEIHGRSSGDSHGEAKNENFSFT